MVHIGSFGMGIFPETFVFGIVIMINLFSGPIRLAFNSKMIISFGGKDTVPILRFPATLRQSDARWDSASLHF
jgi:hypothetical protein